MADSTDRDGSAASEPRDAAADDGPPAEGTSGQPANTRAADGPGRPGDTDSAEPTSNDLDLSGEIPGDKAYHHPVQDSFRARLRLGPDGTDLGLEAKVGHDSRSSVTFLVLATTALVAALAANVLCRWWATSGRLALTVTAGIGLAVLAGGVRFVRSPRRSWRTGRFRRGNRSTGGPASVRETGPGA